MDTLTKSSCKMKACRKRALKTKKGHNATIYRHLKVEGRDRRVYLSIPCAKLLFELNKKLRHRTAGQTVEWLLVQAKPTIDAVMTIVSTNPGLMSPNTDTNPNTFSLPLSTGPMDSDPVQNRIPSVPMALETFAHDMGFPDLAGEGTSGAAQRGMQMAKSSWGECCPDQLKILYEDIERFLLDD